MGNDALYSRLRSIGGEVSQLADKLLYYIFKRLFSLKQGLIIFEGASGDFDESSYALYCYLQQKGKYEFVWMVEDPKAFKGYPNTKFESRYHKIVKIRADYYYARAQFSFYTHMTSSVPFNRKGQTKVFIGHGCAIKGKKGENIVKWNDFDYGIAIGKGAIETQAQYVGCPVEKLVPLGLPRNDLLIKHTGDGIENPFVIGKDFNKVILWMPTFRESTYKSLSETHCATDTGLPLYDSKEKVSKLNAFLRENHCAVILKIHRLQKQKELFKQHFSNIIIIDNKDVEHIGKQLYEVIGYSDALLTDYSSVSIDYLLIDKPIGYILSDVNSYTEDRGFTTDDPREMMAGEFIYTEQDCMDFIKNVIRDHDEYKPARKQLTKKLHAAPNGNSCELFEEFFFGKDSNH